ncbi:type 2 lanthipeptide synthetase LanM family protein [Sorangium sp. So ce448]|uniref:type 2 lanthipeptide synthetase LanM family protein n=1 Tax=Sorangium sp. So ce448 TaxID=3133314 RepID=UPI003F635600
MPSAIDLRAIVARALPLGERIAHCVHAEPRARRNREVEARLERWRSALRVERLEDLEERLSLDGLSIDAVCPALEDALLPSNIEVPGWATVLREALEESAVGREEGERAPPGDIPFAPVYTPFLRVARRRLAARCPSGVLLLSAEARADLEQGLWRWLGHLSAQALELEFSLLRAAGWSPLARMFDDFSGEPSRRLYEAFLAELAEGGLAGFFSEYCVLARLVGSAIELFVDASAELLDRLERDRDTINSAFCAGTQERDLGPVVRVHPYLSDRHRGGRAVTGISFASGISILYKPKDLGLDEMFGDLLRWLNQRSGLLPLEAPRSLRREGYGWVEIVESRPCRDRDESSRYFRRAGMLLCLAHALAGIDLHNENIIACGEHPVLIDLEMLLSPRPRSGRESAPHAGGFDPGLDSSVLQTGLLPYYEVGPDGVLYDGSGLGGARGGAMGFGIMVWSEINTDRMELTFSRHRSEHRRGDPAGAGGDLGLAAHEDDLVEGFRSMYGVLLQQRASMLAPEGPLAAMSRGRVRVVLRPTRLYDLLLTRSLRPDCLRHGADRGIELEALASCPPTATDPIALWPLFRDEIAALERMDVPVFVAAAHSEDLMSEAGTTVPGALEQSGYHVAVERLLGLRDVDLVRQIAFIRGAVGANVAATRSRPFLSSEAERRGGPHSVEDLLAAARAIGDGVRARAIVTEEGATWTGPYHVEGGRRRRVLLMGYGLFDGSSGVALFLAALSRQTGDRGYGDLARLALDPLRRSLRLGRFEAIAAAMGAGGAAGFASLSYALMRAGDFLGEPGALDDAARVAALLTEERIRATRGADVIDGVAGTLLSLLALHARTHDAGILAKAVVCGDVLLGTRAPTATGARSWMSLGDRFLTGFSHGAAGIAAALMRLYGVTGRDDLRAAALEGIAYEAALFDEDSRNWPDLRLPEEDGASSFGTSWCQGAPGIGLGRLACADVLESPALELDIGAAVDATLRADSGEIDQLCCGAMGRVELLMTVARRRGRPELEHAAIEIVREVLRRAERRGSFGFGLKGAIDSSTLFQGASGIGYQMLRLAAPNVVPSLLLWE